MWKINKYTYKSIYFILFFISGLLSLYFYINSDHTPLNYYYPTNHYAGLYGEIFYFIFLIYRVNIFKRLRSLTLIRLKKELYGIQLFNQFMLNLILHTIFLYGPTLIIGWSYINSYTMLMIFFILLFIQYFLVEMVALFIIYTNSRTLWITSIIFINLAVHYIVVPLIFF